MRALKAPTLEFDRRIIAWHRSNATSKRLDAIPDVGPALATALVANIADPKAFRSGRDFSAWVGLVPKQNSSGGKDKLGSISKQGDPYVRSLFTAGALAVIAMLTSMVPIIGPGSLGCWLGAPRRLPLSHSPTNSRRWRGL
ncbi:transposase [Bradyrhizobium sp. CCBAU 65884]|uniref:transposase n=1 Tax=Bradyrhizobium sp. CCBAU 65884 TaxID=722477 RepID=UPI003FA45698